MGERILKLIMDILSTPAVLVALISFIGLIIQKKSASDITKGTVKTSNDRARDRSRNWKAIQIPV